MLKKTFQYCPVCDSKNQKIKYSPWITENDPIKLYGAASGIPGTQYLVTCLDCGMIFESPRYDAKTIISGYMASSEAIHDSQYDMRVYSFYWALKKHKKLLPLKGAKILDIGTAGGAFLEASEKFGYDAYGLEPSFDLVARGKARGLKIEQGTIEKHNYKLGTFDIVCLWDVIEHLPDPKFTLHEIKKLLKPNGIIVINFPDIGTWQAKIAGKRFWWILSVHLHHFSRKTISGICVKTGFEVLSIKRFWQVLEFGYLQKMAIVYKLPFAVLFCKFTPKFIKQIPIPYYASQTTVLAKALK